MRSVTWAIAVILFSAYSADLRAQNAPPQDTSVESAPSSPTLTPHNSANHPELEKKTLPSSSIGSLALVLGLFFALAWAFRRMLPPGAGPLPPEAFEMLGRAPLANRQQAHLLRCGGKVLLVAVGAAGVAPLAEITDPAEVDRLTTLCRQSRPNVTTAFRHVLGKKGRNDA